MLYRLSLAALLLFLFSVPVYAQDECPASQFEAWGAIGVVTPGNANNLRAEPSTSAALVGRVLPGEVFRVNMNGITCAEGYLWREIQTQTQRGWTVEIAVDDDEPFIVPYVAPAPRSVGQRQEDGSFVVEESGVRFVVSAGLGIDGILMEPRVGLFGDVMSAQPSSVVFSFVLEDERVQEWLQIFPYAVSDATASYWEDNPLPMLLAEKPDLTEPTIRSTLPQTPIGGVRALFHGAPQYVPFASGEGLRYLSYFAQNWVLFEAGDTFAYLYRGISADRSFFIAARLPARPPASAIPTGGALDEESYPRYLRQLEANLDALPTSAYTPDIALYDAMLASLTFGNPEDVMTLLP